MIARAARAAPINAVNEDMWRCYVRCVSSSHTLTPKMSITWEQQRRIKYLKYRKLRHLEQLALLNRRDEFFQHLHETPFSMLELARDSPPCSEYDRALVAAHNFIVSRIVKHAVDGGNK